MARPRVVITTDRRPEGPAGTVPGRIRPGRPEVFLGEAYVRAVAEAGGLPILVAPVEDLEGDLVAWILGNADAVVISGGPADIAPRWYGEVERVPFGRTDDHRAALEIALARACMERGLPVLGVCGGLQVLAVAAGGTLVQDVGIEVPGALGHQQPTDPREPWHPVLLEPGPLRDATGEDEVRVNSTHRQAVLDPGPFRVTGRAPDGVIEAIELAGHPFCAGVQWHPEALGGPEGTAHRFPYRALLTATR